MNNRRKLLLALGAAALGSPLTPHAQPQGKVWRIGFLSPRNRPASLDSQVFGAFLRGMRELGYFEEKNLMIEWRFAESKADRLPELAAELVRLKVDLIVAAGTPGIGAAQKATTTIPIVIVDVADPVGSGFVKSLARPAGNITGLSNLNVDISPKLLEMLLSMAPKLSRVAVLMNPANPSNTTVLQSVQAAALRVKVKVKVLPMEARTLQEIEKAFSTMAREKTGAVIVPRDALFTPHLRHIAELAAKHRLPSISLFLEYAEAGGLMVYGSNATDIYRRAATYVDKIFKGAKAGDIPVEQPTKFELIINGRTAKALGLKIPYSLQIMADKVIE